MPQRRGQRHNGADGLAAAEQGVQADEALAGTQSRTAGTAGPKVPARARAGAAGRGHRFAA